MTNQDHKTGNSAGWSEGQDPGWESFDLRVRRAALSEFRRSRDRRSAWRRGALGLLAAGLGFGAVLSQKRGIEGGIAQEARGKPAPQKFAGPEVPQSILISDRELVASFPANSCFLAEVDGKKVLIFRDEAVREQYFPKLKTFHLRHE